MGASDTCNRGTLDEWQQRLGGYAKRNARRLRIVPDSDWKDYKSALSLPGCHDSVRTAYRIPSDGKIRTCSTLSRSCMIDR